MHLCIFNYFSVSTFCLWPAVAAGGKGTSTQGTTAYFPVTKLIAKGETRVDYGPGFKYVFNMGI